MSNTSASSKGGKKSGIVRKKQSELKKKIKAMLTTGEITDLQRNVLENWAEMVDDPNPQVRAFATKEISKYLFAQKREHQIIPDVSIQTTFIGIKDFLRKDIKLETLITDEIMKRINKSVKISKENLITILEILREEVGK